MISGSLRASSNNSALLRTARTLMPDGFRGVHYEGMAELPHFNPDDDHDPLHPSVIDLRARIAESAALLICTPEYAGALPGSFKNLLDWTVGGIEIGDKPTAWVNVSANSTKAVNAYASLRLVLRYTGATIVDKACVHVPVVPSMMDSQGLIDDDWVRDGITRSLTALVAHVAVAAA